MKACRGAVRGRRAGPCSTISPASMTAMRWATEAVSRSWVIRTSAGAAGAGPASSPTPSRPARTSRNAAPADVSRPEVISSQIRTRGWVRSARAGAARWSSPPDNWAGSRCASSGREAQAGQGRQRLGLGGPGIDSAQPGRRAGDLPQDRAVLVERGACVLEGVLHGRQLRPGAVAQAAGQRRAVEKDLAVVVAVKSREAAGRSGLAAPRAADDSQQPPRPQIRGVRGHPDAEEGRRGDQVQHPGQPGAGIGAEGARPAWHAHLIDNRFHCREGIVKETETGRRPVRGLTDLDHAGPVGR